MYTCEGMLRDLSLFLNLTKRNMPNISRGTFHEGEYKRIPSTSIIQTSYISRLLLLLPDIPRKLMQLLHTSMSFYFSSSDT